MLGSLKTVIALGAVLAGTSVVCPICVPGAAANVTAGSATAGVAAGVLQQGQAADTASARFHISGMFCATCPVTARVALSKVPGVYSAKVTIDDSLGVVRYDPRRATPARIASELKRMTGYVATVLADSGTVRRKTRGT
ncbi:MAG: cation transporter [Gemmatimonadetes bacterium]|nr:cation transporter [Gemmatimonadota bacterium]